MATILERVQANPEIGTQHATQIGYLIERAKALICEELQLPRFPELAQGYSKSAATPSTDISGLATAKLLISVNGSSAEEIELTLTGLTSGAAIATHLQSVVQAVDEDAYGFDEVMVVYDSGVYTITSGRFGEDSKVQITFSETYKDVAEALKLSPAYGGTELCGSAVDESLDELCVLVTEVLYRNTGVEGVKSGTVPGEGSFTKDSISKFIRENGWNKQRLWKNWRRP